MGTKDLLIEKLSCAEENPEKADILNDLSEIERNTDVRSSLLYAEDAIKLSSTIEYKKGEARGYWLQGVCLRLLSDYKSALKSFESALGIYNETKDTNGLARVLNSVSNIYADINEHKKSLNLCRKSLELIRLTNDKEFEAIILTNIGLEYQNSGNYEEALDSYNEAVKLFQEHNISIKETLYSNIGTVHYNLENYKTAIEYYFKSLEQCIKNNNIQEKGFSYLNISDAYSKLSDYENAVKYFNQSLELLDTDKRISAIDFEQNDNVISKVFILDFSFKLLKLRTLLNDKIGMCSTYLTIGDIYFGNYDYSNANNYYNDCSTLAGRIKNDVFFSNALVRSAYVELYRNNIDKSEELLQQAYESASSRNAARELSKINFALYEVYKKAGNFAKALKHHEEFYKYEQEMNCYKTDKSLQVDPAKSLK